MIDRRTREAIQHAIGLNVRRIMAEKGLDQGVVAERLGISRQQVNRIVQGYHCPTTPILFGLADLLGVKADDLRQIPVHSS